ncbi:aldehyde dehydrogenase family protein, partial [Listeria monocytogenes]|uniref:aldehyde dehydrogenase family protein n=1 Tax=Listeria monocytogenes TaxID=1639 RepID=UPI00122D8167
IGMLKDDNEKRVMGGAVPLGVVEGLIPTTSPASTVNYKTLISIKAGNSSVFSPHPNALKAILDTESIISEAAEKDGCPKGDISWMTVPTIQGTDQLMNHKDTAVIL